MKTSKPLQDKLGDLLRTNKFTIILEIVIVFLPMYLGLILSDSIGSDHVPLGGNLVLKGGPIAYLGLIISLVFFWVASILRGASWGDFGVTRQKSWFRTVLMSIGVALAVLGVVVMIINPAINTIPNLEPRDMSSFSYLTGNLPNLIINLVFMLITAGFLEELLWRGYLMNRLIDLQGKQTKLVWVIALVSSAAIFGLGHFYQGPIGIFKTGVIGLVFGLAYLAVGRNLWPLILSHAFIDSIDFIGHYFGA